MDLMELGDMGSGCEDKNCNLASGFPEDCSNQECQEPMFGLIELVSVTVIYIPLMIFGLLGNILTILVVWLRPHMRSSTYLYLSSMAVSDLLILLLLPLDLYKLWRPRPWPLGDLACKLTMFLSECCTFCTILHITFLSLERYLAVCWPITAKTLVTRRRTRVLIGCLWMGAAVSAAPVLVMVGVEEVGGEELGLSGWREDGGWTGREGEQGEFIIDGGKRGSEYMDGRLEGIKWEERETKGWGEIVGELKWFEENGEIKLGIGETGEEKQGKGGEKKDEEQADEGGGEHEGKTDVDGKQQNKMKEDEGGGRGGGVDGGHGGEPDKKECRCTHYAVTSGLLSAMMILSNLYFLVPLCILGLVYSLIGRTLWLRPQSSRRDQSHRHTVKMLGVIVLAFVLCWLPFHVGRTIFSLSLGASADRQEMYMDTNSYSDSDTLSDGTVNKTWTGGMTTHTHTEKDKIFCDNHAQTDVEIKTQIHVDTHLADAENEMHADTDAHSEAMSSDKHLFSLIISHTRGQGMNNGTSKTGHSIDTDTHTTTHTETHSDPAHVNAQLGKSADSRDLKNPLHSSTNSATRNRQNRTYICIKSQDDTLSHTPSASDTDNNTATPTDLYNSNAHTDTHFNNTFEHPDAHLYFLYYLSQYFNLVSSVLFYLSAAVNPLLYNLMSARYRHAVQSLMHTHSRTPSHRLRTTLTARQSTTNF